MTELHDFERRVREDVVRTAQLFRAPTGAAERAIDAARAQVELEPLRERHVRHWIVPLAAAAAVLVIASGVTFVNHASQGIDPVGPSPSPLPSVSPSPTTTPSPTTAPTPTTAPPPAALTHRVTLGTATLSIPSGWAARRMPEGPPGWPASWCLEPSTTPLPKLTDPNATCLVMFREVPDSWTDQPLDPTLEGGLSSNPSYCNDGRKAPPGLLDYADRTFGGRPADYRRWQYDCANGTTYRIEQYVVATGPGYVLFSEHADSNVHDAMATIAKTASVPAQSTPLRYADTGFVRSVRHESDGYHITLDRVVTASRLAPINNNPATYPYVIPDTIESNFSPALKVGDLIFIATDGYHVKQANPY
jgi:hypothetical protein